MSMPPPPIPGTSLPDVNKGPAILISCGTLTIIAIVAVVIRMYVRIRMIKACGLDDYSILIALALSTAGMGIIIPEVMNGAGRHVMYLHPSNITKGLYLNFITQPIYLWTVCFVKVSVAFFLLRIAPSQAYKRFLRGGIAFLLIYNFICFLTIMLECRPLRFLWDGPSVKAKCFSVPVLHFLSYTSQTLAILTDLIFATMPILMLRNVQMKPRVKIAIMGIMGLGLFACVASIIKFSYLPSYGKTGDFLWDSQNLTIWSVVESNVGIITASIPCMKPLFRRLLDLTTNITRSNNSSHKQSGGFSGKNSRHSYPLSPFKPHDGMGRVRASIVGNHGPSGKDTVKPGSVGSDTFIMKTVRVEISRSSSEGDEIMATEGERKKSLTFANQFE